MNFLTHILRSFIASIIFATGMTEASAGVVIGGTRVIFDGSKKEASISINNPDSLPYLIQSWVEMPDVSTKKAPFIITPPLYRLDAGQKNVERIVMTGGVPQDKESLYWLNIKTIPSLPRQDNSLQIAVKTRIKLIYRPAGLKDLQPDELASKLIWRRFGNQVQVVNPTERIINFNEINISGKSVEEVSYVLPGATALFNLPKGVSGGAVTFKIINDYGAAGKTYNASI